MLYYFSSEDVYRNQVKTYPKCVFWYTTGNIILYNFEPKNSKVTLGPSGSIDVHEFVKANFNPYPWRYKDNARDAFTSTTNAIYTSSAYGMILSSTYAVYKKLSSDFYNTNSSSGAGDQSNIMNSITGTMRNYAKLSPSFLLGNYASKRLRVVTIPKDFFGDEIKKKSLKLQCVQANTLKGELRDVKGNGELISTYPLGSTSGSIAGVVLYDQGLLVLTGSWDLGTAVEGFDEIGKAKWNCFFSTASHYETTNWSLEFQGVNHVNTITMNCNALPGHLNHSNNPTFISYSATPTSSYPVLSNAYSYKEYEYIPIANIVKTNFTGSTNITGNFQKTTYISKIAIYDEDKNVLGIAKLATPVRKKENDSYTFRIKFDF